MTYGRVSFANRRLYLAGAGVSHLAELVRGNCVRRPPHPALRATFSPRGEGARTARSQHLCIRFEGNPTHCIHRPR
jgi:hypothetical protein